MEIWHSSKIQEHLLAVSSRDWNHPMSAVAMLGVTINYPLKRNENCPPPLSRRRGSRHKGVDDVHQQAKNNQVFNLQRENLDARLHFSLTSTMAFAQTRTGGGMAPIFFSSGRFFNFRC